MSDRIEHISKTVFEHHPHQPPGSELWGGFTFREQVYRIRPLRVAGSILADGQVPLILKQMDDTAEDLNN